MFKKVVWPCYCVAWPCYSVGPISAQGPGPIWAPRYNKARPRHNKARPPFRTYRVPFRTYRVPFRTYRVPYPTYRVPCGRVLGRVFGRFGSVSTPGKDARRSHGQNPAARVENGAIWCKLRPKTIWAPDHLGPIWARTIWAPFGPRTIWARTIWVPIGPGPFGSIWAPGHLGPGAPKSPQEVVQDFGNQP